MSALKIRQWAWPFIKNFRTYIDVGALDGDTTKPFINDFKNCTLDTEKPTLSSNTAFLFKNSSFSSSVKVIFTE